MDKTFLLCQCILVLLAFRVLAVLVILVVLQKANERQVDTPFADAPVPLCQRDMTHVPQTVTLEWIQHVKVEQTVSATTTVPSVIATVAAGAPGTHMASRVVLAFSTLA